MQKNTVNLLKKKDRKKAWEEVVMLYIRRLLSLLIESISFGLVHFFFFFFLV